MMGKEIRFQGLGSEKMIVPRNIHWREPRVAVERSNAIRIL